MILQIVAFSALLQAQFDIRSTPWSCRLPRFPHCYKRELNRNTPWYCRSPRFPHWIWYSLYPMILQIAAFSAWLQAYFYDFMLLLATRKWDHNTCNDFIDCFWCTDNNYCMKSRLRKMAELSHYRQQSCKWIKDSSPQAPPKIAPIETSEVSCERVPGMEAGAGGSLRNRSVAYGSSQDMYVPYVLWGMDQDFLFFSRNFQKNISFFNKNETMIMMWSFWRKCTGLVSFLIGCLFWMIWCLGELNIFSWKPSKSRALQSVV